MSRPATEHDQTHRVFSETGAAEAASYEYLKEFHEEIRFQRKNVTFICKLSEWMEEGK